MQVEIKKLEDSQIEIIGEIPAGDFEFCRKDAVKKLSENVNIDGFRIGNIPEKILMDKIGDHVILEEMAEICLKKSYPKIIEENKIQAIGHPEISITKIAKDNPLGFKIKTTIIPEIKLADYKNISSEIMKKKEEIKVEEKEIDQAIEQLRKARAIKNEKGEEILPEINNDFVKTLGDFDNIESFRKVIHENLVAEKKMKLKEKKRIEILDKVISLSKIEVPKIIIESEKNKMLNEMKANIEQMNLKWEDYLKHLKKTEEEILNGWNEDALKRAKYGLAISEIAQKEKILVSQEELEKESDRLIDYYKNAGQNIDREKAKSYVYGILYNEKVFKFLELC